MILEDLKTGWKDNPAYHKQIHETFAEYVKNDPILNEHRSWVRSNVFGFGEDSFHWLWKLITDEMPENVSFCEVGVFRAQIVSLIKLLRKDAKVFGVTPMDNSGGMWDSDYEADIKRIHEQFNLPMPHIFKGSSLDLKIIDTVRNFLFDVVYVDGDHTYNGASSDIDNYSKTVKLGGYLVIDDCNNEMNMPFGYFQGISEVTEAKQSWLATNPPFEFVCSVVHISVFKRI
jgi:hypothetical protein